MSVLLWMIRASIGTAGTHGRFIACCVQVLVGTAANGGLLALRWQHFDVCAGISSTLMLYRTLLLCRTNHFESCRASSSAHARPLLLNAQGKGNRYAAHLQESFRLWPELCSCATLRNPPKPTTPAWLARSLPGPQRPRHPSMLARSRQSSPRCASEIRVRKAQSDQWSGFDANTWRPYENSPQRRRPARLFRP
jgi:hypothetical protein